MTRDQWLDRVASGEKFDASDVEEIIEDWDKEVAEALENDPFVEPCRRCGEVKPVGREGYCSEGCEMGFKPGEWWR